MHGNFFSIIFHNKSRNAQENFFKNVAGTPYGTSAVSRARKYDDFYPKRGTNVFVEIAVYMKPSGQISDALCVGLVNRTACYTG